MDRLVLVRWTHYCAYTPSLSNLSSLSGLTPIKGWEILSWGGFPAYMLSAVILSVLSYPAFTLGRITGTPEVRPFRSSRTRNRSSQISYAHSRYGPNCLTTFWTQLTYQLFRQEHRWVAMYGKDKRWRHLSVKPTSRLDFPSLYESKIT